MFDTSVNPQDDVPYREMVYFPLKIDALIISVLLSATTTAAVVLLSLIFKLYKRPLALMVLAISIAHVIFHFSKLSVLVFRPHSDLHCRFLSIFIIFGIESAAIWGALFAHAFYIITKYQSTHEIQRMMKYYLLFAVLLPIVNGVLSFFTGHIVYSEAQQTCVHRLYLNHFDFSSNIYVAIPIWISCLSSIIWYRMAIKNISGLQNSQTGSELYILMIYPGILLFCWCPNVVIQTLTQFGLPPSNTVAIISVFIVNMQGFFDALGYGRSVREALSASFNNGCKRNFPNEEQTYIEPQTLEEKRVSSMSAGNYSLLSVQNELDINRNQSTVDEKHCGLRI